MSDEKEVMSGEEILRWLEGKGVRVELRPVAKPAERVTKQLHVALTRNKRVILEAVCCRYLAMCRATGSPENDLGDDGQSDTQSLPEPEKNDDDVSDDAKSRDVPI